MTTRCDGRGRVPVAPSAATGPMVGPTRWKGTVRCPQCGKRLVAVVTYKGGKYTARIPAHKPMHSPPGRSTIRPGFVTNQQEDHQ